MLEIKEIFEYGDWLNDFTLVQEYLENKDKFLELDFYLELLVIDKQGFYRVFPSLWSYREWLDNWEEEEQEEIEASHFFMEL